MKQGWKTYRLGDLCDTISDSYKGCADEVVLINTSDVLEGKCLNHTKEPNRNLKGQFKKTFKKYDILYSEIRPANKRFAYIDFDATNYIASTKLMVLRHNEKIEPLYLYYILQSQSIIDELQMLAESRSGTFPQITFAELSRLEVKLPNREVQRQILGILGAIDDKIENNRRINTNLELQAQALYKQWFVDNRKDDWEKKKLESIIDIGSGKGLARIDFVEDGLYPILGANGQIGRTNNFLIDKKDNVLFTGRVGTLGNVFRLQQKRAWLSDNTLIITPKKKYYNYVYFFLKSSNLKDFNVGSTQPLIRQSDIKEMDILIPDYLTLEAFENKCIAMFDKINQANAEIDSLATLRDTLLPKLMNGEIITK